MLPALLLERVRRKLAYPRAPRAKRELFIRIENATVEQIAEALRSMMGTSTINSVSGTDGTGGPALHPF
ncbi:MAG: hypothetical protein HY905_15755 [Deltaproteobacteria bacterium]|nr:hypothetical protein [Deltaproteobacteria bacterium]